MICNSLTETEKKIIDCLEKGMLYKEIALANDIKIDTVKKHCSNIYKKLKVRNKTEAINLYQTSLNN
jgi:two-component system, NarL family, response regulator LiaR